MIKAMILSAGLGTRFKPWTDKHPKALAPVNGKSLLQRNIEYLHGFGINDFVINVHHFADQILDAVADHKGWGVKISVSDEQVQLLETGGGIKHAAPLLRDAETIVVMNADILTDLDMRKMIHFHESSKALATVAVLDRKTHRYFLFDEKMTLSGWKNIQSGDEKITRPQANLQAFAFSGVHVLNSKIFNLIKAEGKFSIIDTYLELSPQHIIKGYNHTGSRFIDVGKPESVEQAEKIFE